MRWKRNGGTRDDCHFSIEDCRSNTPERGLPIIQRKSTIDNLQSSIQHYRPQGLPFCRVKRFVQEKQLFHREARKVELAAETLKRARPQATGQQFAEVAGADVELDRPRLVQREGAEDDRATPSADNARARLGWLYQWFHFAADQCFRAVRTEGLAGHSIPVASLRPAAAARRQGQTAVLDHQANRVHGPGHSFSGSEQGCASPYVHQGPSPRLPLNATYLRQAMPSILTHF